MLGYTEKYMKELYRDIIAFAELETFEAMAFSKPLLRHEIPARLLNRLLGQSDILILDEVLAVGDAGFRKKSEMKMEIIEGGAITLLVSHSVAQVPAVQQGALARKGADHVRRGGRCVPPLRGIHRIGPQDVPRGHHTEALIAERGPS